VNFVQRIMGHNAAWEVVVLILCIFCLILFCFMILSDVYDYVDVVNATDAF
jgi:hypothetical protein